ncbi:hypothetical protein ACF06X_33520 [Streptomyces sp. NPDC015346]|uniref:hypothetical protein n=1 Tax=Streptomyces sp. NPDC015346 TaxID=3364954 RepID=UPI0036FEEA0C
MPSSAEPAPTTPAPDHGGAVIHHLAHRRARRGEPPAAPVAGPAPDGIEAQIAETVQAYFLSRGRTLTDEPTAVAFDITLEAVRQVLDGALATHIVEETAHTVLVEMLDGLRQSPQNV